MRCTGMSFNRCVTAVSMVLLCFTVSVRADEKADGAIKELDQQYAKLKSYTAKTESMTDFAFGPDQTQKTEMAGTVEWQRDGEKVRMHSDMKGTTSKTENGETKKSDATITTVSDGEFLWVLNVEGDKKSVYKNRAPSADDSRPSAIFNQMAAYYDVKLLPDASVNGADCYVFELKMKPMEGMPPSGHQVIHYQKDSGVSVKSESFDANNKLTSSWITSDIKLNADVAADRFKFEVPAGAEVTDATAIQPPPAQAEPAEPTEQPKEEAAPKAEEEQKPEKEKDKKKDKGIKLPKWPK